MKMNKENKSNKKEKKSIIILTLALCIIILLNIIQVIGTIDLRTPEDQTYTNQQYLIFEYYLSMNNATNCSLIIDSSISNTQTTLANPGFNEITGTLTTGEHQWNIKCTNNTHTEEGNQTTIIIDTSAPIIVLFNPENAIEIKSSEVEFSFVTIDNSGQNIECNLIIDDIIEASVTAENSQPQHTIITDIEDGEHEWKVTCNDLANNTNTSEIKTFVINTTNDNPEFNATLERNEMNIGQNSLMNLNAPSGTDIRVEVCPDTSGFVECEVPIDEDNVTDYPIIENIPFTNQEGIYILEAFFDKDGFTETKTLTYKVNNNIQINIEGGSDVKKNVPVILEASATGGVGDITYEWDLSDGTTSNESIVNITYTSTGEHEEKVIVKDSYNNTAERIIIIDVSDTYQITILIKDKTTDNIIKEATVELDGEQETSDNNGQATFDIKEGTRKLLILATGYKIYQEDLNISKKQTFTILLEPKENNEPIITLIKPEDNGKITGNTTDLTFKAEHLNELNCSIYINENKDGFFTYIGDMKVKDNNNNLFPIIGLEEKTYWWKVECKDNKGNIGMSSTYKFTSVPQNESSQLLTTTESNPDTASYNEWIKEYEELVSAFETMPKDVKEAAEKLEIINNLKNSIKTIKNAVRDIDGLRFNQKLTEQEKEQRKQEWMSEAEQAYDKAPINIDLTESETYVDYISNEELELLVDEYISAEFNESDKKINKKKLLNLLEELQQEAVISSKIKIGSITLRDGTKEDYTLIIREIKLYNITEESFAVEIIPKEVIKNAEEVISNLNYKIIKKDPIIRFDLDGDKTITYYFNKKIDVDEVKKIKTAIFIDLDSDDSKITGLTINTPKIKNIFFFPILIIILGGIIFSFVKYNGLDTAKVIAYNLVGKKDLHYINIILTEIKENLEMNNIEKAHQLYNEAREAYSSLSTIAKNDIYNKIIETTSLLHIYDEPVQEDNISDSEETSEAQSSETASMPELKVLNKSSIIESNDINNKISLLQKLIDANQIHDALEGYKLIEKEYHQTDEITQEKLHPMLSTIGNNLQEKINSMQ